MLLGVCQSVGSLLHLFRWHLRSSAWQKCPDQAGLQETSFPWHRVSSALAVLCLALLLLPVASFFHSWFPTAQNPKGIGWDLKDLPLAALCHGQGHLPLDWIAPRPGQPGFWNFHPASLGNITQSKQEAINHPLYSEILEQNEACFANPDAVW